MNDTIHYEIIENLTLTDEKKDLLQYIGTEILDDIIDYIEIRFPIWQEELGTWAAEYILYHILFYEDIYNVDRKEREPFYLYDVYSDLNKSYRKFVSNYQFVLFLNSNIFA